MSIITLLFSPIQQPGKTALITAKKAQPTLVDRALINVFIFRSNLKLGADRTNPNNLLSHNRPYSRILPDSAVLPSFGLTSRRTQNRQYDNCERAYANYPVSVIDPVHLLLVFHALQTLFQLVIGFTFHALLLSFHAYEPSSFSSRLPSRSTPHFPAL